MTPRQVVILTCYNGQGQLLVGKRSDTGNYTLPGGHIEGKEEPHEAARRELFEEAGLRPLSLSLIKHYITAANVELWCFSAFVSGEPHGNYDPDGEVSEWEFIDVEEGLPPKVFNHLHGPQGSDNLVTQIFGLQKAESDMPKVYHSEDWGAERVSIPGKDHPDRAKYDQAYLDSIRHHHGHGLTPTVVGTEELDHEPEVHSKTRFDLYRKMFRAGERLPPIVVQRKGKRYQVLDGNHKVHAARAEGGGKLDAVVVDDTTPAPLTKAEEELMKALKFKAGFRHPETGHIQTTGSFHDIDQLPEQHAHEYEAGFVDESGKFYTRREAAKAINPTSHVYQNHLHLDSANLEGNWQKTGDVYRGLNPENLGKAEDEVHRMLQHPDATERTMALKLGSVTPAHVLSAALDPDPSVHQFAIAHRNFGPTEAHQLLEATAGSDGKYPLTQQSHLLAQHERISPAHLTSFLRSARSHSPDSYDIALKLAMKHPAATPEHLRAAYMDPSTPNDVSMDILSHAHAPADVLGHAIQLGILVPGPISTPRACKAAEHMNAPNATLTNLVMLAADKGDPGVNALAEHALEHGKVSQEVQRDLLMRAKVRPQSTAPRLLDALLRGPSAAHVGQQDLDALVQYAHQTGSATMVKSLSEHPAFAPRHLVMLLDKYEEPVAEPLEKFDSSFVSSPQVRDQLGFKIADRPEFKAASFLSDTVRKALVTPEVLRAALYQANGDFERAALMAYGIECTEANLAALRAVMKVGDFQKSEPTPSTAKEIAAARPEGEEVADAVRRAFADRFAFEIQLGGKHSAGSMICYDNKTRTTWLLKSGTGGAGGAAGAAQDSSNPNAREAAFYHITREWGISDAFPRAELLIVDGRLFAALQYLGGSYKTLDKREKDEPGTARRVLHSYLHSGNLHRWAIADYILGQPDRHGQNVMVDEKGTVKLIDEGSTFAGNEFDPGLDKNSFVPYYLRAWHVDPSFNQLPVDQKMRYMPRVAESVARSLREWTDSLSPDTLGKLCQRYEIDPTATLDRLARVKSAMASNPADVAINHLWVTT